MAWRWTALSDAEREANSLDGRTMTFEVAGPGEEPPDWLRRILTLEVWCEDGAPLQHLDCLSAG